MNAPNDNTAAKRLRRWWLTPPRPGLQRLINPIEYRHLRGFGLTRIAGGSVAAAAGLVCLSYGVYGWCAALVPNTATHSTDPAADSVHLLSSDPGKRFPKMALSRL